MAELKPVEVDLDDLVQVNPNQLSGCHDSKPSPPSANGTHTAPTSEEDNMDYDSDDDDDVKSNHSNSNSNSTSNSCRAKKGKKGEEQRSHHNVLERKRRDLIKDSFSKLKESVPTMGVGRSSRAQILKKAADFIQSVHLKNQKTRADLEDLVLKNKELEDKLRSDNTSKAASTADATFSTADTSNTTISTTTTSSSIPTLDSAIQIKLEPPEKPSK